MVQSMESLWEEKEDFIPYSNDVATRVFLNKEICVRDKSLGQNIFIGSRS